MQQSQTLSVKLRSSVGVPCQDSTTSFNSRHSLTYRRASPYRPRTEWCFPVHCRHRSRCLFFALVTPPLLSRSHALRPPRYLRIPPFTLPKGIRCPATLSQGVDFSLLFCMCTPVLRVLPPPLCLSCLYRIAAVRCPSCLSCTQQTRVAVGPPPGCVLYRLLCCLDPGCGRPASRLCFISSALLFVVCMYSTASIVPYVCTLRNAGFASRRPAYASLMLKKYTQGYVEQHRA
ncbi:hypothetical protein C2E23DRAFT_842602 [Lenzites betulinus]|nr:hypothetical protein C2E23DRAFT_842602 [Lenzites betulinus]